MKSSIRREKVLKKRIGMNRQLTAPLPKMQSPHSHLEHAGLGGGKLAEGLFMNFPRLVGLGVFLSLSVLRAQQQDVSAPNAEAILKEIEGLEQKQK